MFPDSQSVPPEVNFSQEMVIVTARGGVFPNSGYTTEIVEIKKEDDITVKVVNKNPRGIVLPVLTCPTHIVRTKRYDLKVRFEKLYPIF